MLFEELDTKIKIFEERSAQPVFLTKESISIEEDSTVLDENSSILEVNEAYSKNSVFEYQEVNINEINNLGVR
ncbi:MAG: hypothetical protein ACYSW3_04505, partial [Planctomycetota bacterium]